MVQSCAKYLTFFLEKPKYLANRLPFLAHRLIIYHIALPIAINLGLKLPTWPISYLAW